nr:hypothetical protein [Tanacetum cinerariifolium]
MVTHLVRNLSLSFTKGYIPQTFTNNGIPSNNGSKFNRFCNPFVRWIEDCPLLDELKMPSYIGSYDGNGDPNNFLHLFKGQKKFTKTYLEVHNIKQREGESTRVFATRYTNDTLQILGLHEDHRISSFVYGLRTKSLVEHLFTDLPSIYKGLMEKTNTWIEAREVATNRAPSDRRENFKRSKKSSWDNNRGQKGRDRQVNRVYLDGGSSCEVIYKHYFLKLKPSIRSLRVDSKIPLVGFSGEQSWPLGEVPLEITIREGPLTVTKTLNFAIVRSDSPHNLLLGRTTMQQIGILVSTIHEAIKFHTPRGTDTVLSQYNPRRSEEKHIIISEEHQEDAKDFLIYVDAEERIVVSDQYPEQTIVIGRQLPTKTKIKLQDLLREYADVFAWTTAHTTRVPRTIIIGGEAFNTEHRVNELKHLEPANILREVKYQTWLSNPVIVKKVDGRWKLKLVALNHFLSKEADKTLPFMRTLKSYTSGKMVQWKTKADEAFRRMKELLEALPMVVVPTKGKTLIMYLGVSKESISAVLMAERERDRQLRRYFQAYPIQVLSDKPIKQILVRPEKSRSIAKWAIELGEHEIKFKGRSSVKGHILADFLAETPFIRNREGRFNIGHLEGKEYTYALRCKFETTNSEAEYEALLAGIRIAKEIKVQELTIFVNSQLVANQVKGLFEARQTVIKQYLEKAKELLANFPSHSIEHIKRNQNKKADALSSQLRNGKLQT